MVEVQRVISESFSLIASQGENHSQDGMPKYHDVLSRVSKTPEFLAAKGDVLRQDRLIYEKFREERDEFEKQQRSTRLSKLKEIVSIFH